MCLTAPTQTNLVVLPDATSWYQLTTWYKWLLAGVYRVQYTDAQTKMTLGHGRILSSTIRDDFPAILSSLEGLGRAKRCVSPLFIGTTWYN
jgi:hypothetical protein